MDRVERTKRVVKEPRVRIILPLEETLVRRLDEYRFATRAKSRTAVVAALLKLALEVEGAP